MNPLSLVPFGRLVVVVAVLIVAGILVAFGYDLGKRHYSERALQAEQALQLFTAEQARLAAVGQAQAVERQRDALAAVAAASDRIVSAVEASRIKVAGQVRTDLQTFTGVTHDPSFDCLRRPLPADAAGVFARPGGTVAPAGH